MSSQDPKPTLAVEASEIAALQKAVEDLGDRITKLSTALNVVNTLQLQQIPREEHEARWRKEQQDLINLRLHIRRRTYIVGAVFFLLSLLALGVTTGLVVRQQHADNAILQAACRSRVQSSKQGVEAYQRLLQSPTISHDGLLKSFIETAYDASVRGSKVKC